MICPNCGAEGYRKFCEHCGAAMTEQDSLISDNTQEGATPFPAANPTSDYTGEDSQAPAPKPTPQPQPQPQYTQACPPPIYDPSLKSRGLLKQAWADIRNDPKAIKTILLLALISLVPILGFVTVGYSLKWARTAAYRTGDPLPDKLFANGHFLLGFYAFVVTVAWICGLCLLAFFPFMISEYLSLISILVLAFIVFAVPLLQLALMYVSLTNRLGSGFRFGNIWSVAAGNYGGLWFIIIVPALIACIVSGAVDGIVGAAGLTNVSLIWLNNVNVSLHSLTAADGMITLIANFLVGLVTVTTNLVEYRALGYWIGRMAPNWVREGLPHMTNNPQ